MTVMSPEIVALASLVVGALGTGAGALWTVLRWRQEMELAWSQRAESLWKETQRLEAEQARLRLEIAEVQAVARRQAELVDRLREEVRRLRAAIRCASSLEELRRQVEAIPTAADCDQAGHEPASIT